MNGKILFYNEEKGWGKIIDSEKNDYFFHINKVKNKPQKINKNDEVEFEYFDTEKGLNAKNIFFITKIKCPVCDQTNEETNKICKNEKCKWDLTYVKDGVFIGLSKNDIENYNEKLKISKINYNTQSKEKFINLIKSIDEDVIYGKITNGKIIHFDDLKGFGYIRGEDGQKYYFHISNTDEPLKIQKDTFVNFLECKGKKGLFAKNIKIMYVNNNIKTNFNTKIDDFDSTNNDLYIDHEQSLMWKINPYQKKRWNDAMNFASNLLYASYDDWRLPTSNELGSFLYEQKKWNIYENNYNYDYSCKFRVDLQTFQDFWTSSDISKKMVWTVSFYTDGYIYDTWYCDVLCEFRGIDFSLNHNKYEKVDKLPFFCVRDTEEDDENNKY